MDMKKIAGASVFALALVACIALFNGNAAESVKYYGESLSNLQKPSITSSPAPKASTFSSVFGSGEHVWDEDEEDSTPVPKLSALSGLSSIMHNEKPQSDFHEDFSHSSVFSVHKPAVHKPAVHKAAAPKKAKQFTWAQLMGTSSTSSASTSSALHNGDTVHVQYKLRLKKTGKEVFRQWGTGQGGTFSFKLGGGHVIPGFDSVISSMKVGASRYGVSVPASRAYGAKGFAAGNIPPNADLDYDLKVVGKN